MIFQNLKKTLRKNWRICWFPAQKFK